MNVDFSFKTKKTHPSFPWTGGKTHDSPCHCHAFQLRGEGRAHRRIPWCVQGVSFLLTNICLEGGNETISDRFMLRCWDLRNRGSTKHASLPSLHNAGWEKSSLLPMRGVHVNTNIVRPFPALVSIATNSFLHGWEKSSPVPGRACAHKHPAPSPTPSHRYL